MLLIARLKNFGQLPKVVLVCLKMLSKRLKKNQSPIVVIEFDFEYQSRDDQICIQLPCIMGGKPNVWKIFPTSILMDMTSNANWLHHVCFDNLNHVGIKLMPPRVIGKGVCLRAKSLFKLLKNFKPKRHQNM
jgi:hypothetical protein